MKINESTKNKIGNALTIIIGLSFILLITFGTAIGIYFICDYFDKSDEYANVVIITDNTKEEFEADIHLKFDVNHNVTDVIIYKES